MKIVRWGRPMSETRHPMAIVVMGVCGTGKSTIGREIADRLGYPYEDADDFHPESNVVKMRSGTALTDADRKPWLDRLRALMTQHLTDGSGIVLACSALREDYRAQLKPADHDLKWLFLQGDRELLAQRLQSRSDHYMPPTLLDSQLATLEVPDPNEALWCNVIDPPETIVQTAWEHFTQTTS